MNEKPRFRLRFVLRSVVEVTPEMAAAWLKNNPHNRPLNEEKVAEFAAKCAQARGRSGFVVLARWRCWTSGGDNKAERESRRDCEEHEGDFGMVSQRNAEGIKIVGVIENGIFPTPTDKVIAEFPNVSEMIEAGWGGGLRGSV